MLFGCAFGEGLEPVGDVRNAIFHRPFLHAARYAVGSLAVEGDAVVNALQKAFQAFRIEVLVHLRTVEHEFSEIIGSFA